MKISVIIPSYKPQDYIYRCLDSLDHQTLPKEQWEVIIILNGCNEPWYTRLSSYIQTLDLPNTRLIQTNVGGVSNARNIGIDVSKGEYITFIDDDDYVSEPYLEMLLQIASPEIVAVSNAIAFDDKNRHRPYAIEDEYQKYSNRKKIPYYILRKCFRGACMKLIHRSIIGDRRFDLRFKNGEDALFMFTISNKMHYIQFSDKSAIYFRYIRQGSASSAEAIKTKRWDSKNHLELLSTYWGLFWHGKNYSFLFWGTRIMGVIHSIFVNKVIAHSQP